MPQSLSSLAVHLVFSTKGRAAMIDVPLQPRLFAYMSALVADKGGRTILINGTPDHVHALIYQPATVALSDFLRHLKANSSRWVRETFPEQRGFGWQRGYGAFSVSRSNVDTVRRYIAGQQEHHRTLSFQEEYREFLKRHAIEFDERYVWD